MEGDEDVFLSVYFEAALLHNFTRLGLAAG